MRKAGGLRYHLSETTALVALALVLMMGTVVMLLEWAAAPLLRSRP